MTSETAAELYKNTTNHIPLLSALLPENTALREYGPKTNITSTHKTKIRTNNNIYSTLVSNNETIKENVNLYKSAGVMLSNLVNNDTGENATELIRHDKVDINPVAIKPISGTMKSLNIRETIEPNNKIINSNTSKSNRDVIVSHNFPINFIPPPYTSKLRSWLMNHSDDEVIGVRNINSTTLSRTRRQDANNCNGFQIDNDTLTFHHPGYPNNYRSNVDCILIISAPEQDKDYIIKLDFRDKFHIEDYPNCTYDFLEIRDGNKGYADLIGTYCGDKFPDVIYSQGPNLWVRFKSDSTIEYEGFKAVVTFNKSTNSKPPINDCQHSIDGVQGVVERAGINPECVAASKGRALDAIWMIEVKTGWRIFLNFTIFNLAFPNECKQNFVDIFGERTEMTDRLKNFCGSMADTVTSTGNILHVRFFAQPQAMPTTNFSAHFTAFRNRDNQGTCEEETEFDCDDATCIDISLKCNGWPNCRLKSDEDTDTCKSESESLLGKTHIVIILVIFSLILSSMSFVFVFKCIRKLVSDHKLIKEHIRQSCEDRLDSIAGSKVILDARHLQRDSMRRDSLQRDRDSLRRDNHRNEMYKRQRNRDKAGSIESELIAETHIDLDDEPWHRNVERNGEIEERRGKDKDKRKRDKGEEKEPKDKKKKDVIDRRDVNDRRDTIDRRDIHERRDTIDRRDKSERRDTIDRRDINDRRDTRGTIDRRATIDRRGTIDVNDVREEEAEDRRKRNVSVGAPDTKESSCQTRESLFQAGTGPSSDGTDSGSGKRGFSTFGYSGSTLLPARRSPPPDPSPPPAVKVELLKTNPPALTIELLKACQQPEIQSKKMPDRRPMSTETTRSAPDVIIVSKPIR